MKCSLSKAIKYNLQLVLPLKWGDFDKCGKFDNCCYFIKIDTYLTLFISHSSIFRHAPLISIKKLHLESVFFGCWHNLDGTYAFTKIYLPLAAIIVEQIKQQNNSQSQLFSENKKVFSQPKMNQSSNYSKRRLVPRLNEISHTHIHSLCMHSFPNTTEHIQAGKSKSIGILISIPGNLNALI